MHHFTALIVLLTTAAMPTLAEPAIYRAEYVAEYQGLPVRARGIREFTSLGDNRYRLVSSATSLFANVTESTEFMREGDALTPLNYEYHRKGMGKNEHKSLHFDWEQERLFHEDSSSALARNTLDKLAYQYKLRTDVAAAIKAGMPTTELSYHIADEEKRKTYDFRITGEEMLETPVGSLRTVRVERVRDNEERQTIFWLAADHEFLLIRLIQLEDKKGFELNLDSAVIDGVPL